MVYRKFHRFFLLFVFLIAQPTLTGWAEDPSDCARSFGLLLSKDKAAIYKYTGGEDYEVINQYLRAGKIHQNVGGSLEVQAKVDALRDALVKLPDSKGQFRRYIQLGGHVIDMPKRFPWYKGTVLDFDEIDAVVKGFRKGEIYSDPGFMSTTSNDVPTGMLNYSVIEMKINGQTSKDISNVSNYGAEMEHVFLPGTKFRIIDVRGEFERDWFSNSVVKDLPKGKNLEIGVTAAKPDVSEWVKFVKHYQNLFPGVTAAEVETMFGRPNFKIPNIVIELEELPR